MAAVFVLVCLVRHPRRPFAVSAGQLTLRNAAGLALFGWVMLFGWATLRAVWYLIAPFDLQVDVTWWAVTWTLITSVGPAVLFAVLFFLAVCRTVAVRPGEAGLTLRLDGKQRGRLFAEALLFMVAVTFVGFSLSLVSGLNHDPWATPNIGPGPHPWVILGGFVAAVGAAVTEELVVVAAPVLLLRAAGMRTSRMVLVLVIGRVAYHVYYGWVSAGLVVWAAAAVWLYLRTSLLSVLIIGHVLFDSINGGLARGGYLEATQLAWLAVFFALVGAVVVSMWRAGRQRWRRFRAVVSSGGVTRWQLALDELLPRQPVRARAIARAGTRLYAETHAEQAGLVTVIGPHVVDLAPESMRALMARQAARVQLGDIPTKRQQRRRTIAGVLLVLTVVTGYVIWQSGETVHRTDLTIAGLVMAIVPVVMALTMNARKRRQAHIMDDALDTRTIELVGAAAPLRQLLEAQSSPDSPLLAHLVPTKCAFLLGEPARRLARLPTEAVS